MSFDRDLILERVDLSALADEVLGPRAGRGRSASWACPDPGHGPQTGRTPPVTIFLARNGTPRWHCHACGAGGTAVDLVATTQGVGVRDALAMLAARAGVGESSAPRLRRPYPRRPPSPSLPPLSAAATEVQRYVAACEAYLGGANGGRWRAWLEGRGLPEAVLRANRVGADPGPRHLVRPPGLPQRGPAVVLPLLTPDGRVAYLQARYLDADRSGRKYDNPAHGLAANPRVGYVASVGRPAARGLVVVCEGPLDALSVAGAGVPAVAVLGAGLPDASVARRVVELAGNARVVVAFDRDARGTRGAERLRANIDELGHAASALAVPAGDVNDWARRAGARFGAELSAAATRATRDAPRVDRDTTRSLA
jgi:DNA primase